MDGSQIELDDLVWPISSESPNRGIHSGTRPLGSEPRNRSVAEEVIGRKGQCSRFAERWFWRKGRRSQEMSTANPNMPEPTSAQKARLRTPTLGLW